LSSLKENKFNVKKVLALVEDGVNLVPVPDFPYYWVNPELGTVISTKCGRWRTLIGSTQKDGYKKVTMTRRENGKSKVHTINTHLIVMAACVFGYWEPLKLEGWEVNHKNRTPWDNKLENLEYIPKALQYTPDVRRDMGKKSHLTDEQALYIRKQFQQYKGKLNGFVNDMKSEFEVSYGVIYNVVKNITFKYLDELYSDIEVPVKAYESRRVVVNVG
jgi:hypothetical protein